MVNRLRSSGLKATGGMPARKHRQSEIRKVPACEKKFCDAVPGPDLGGFLTNSYLMETDACEQSEIYEVVTLNPTLSVPLRIPRREKLQNFFRNNPKFDRAAAVKQQERKKFSAKAAVAASVSLSE
ncbi:hypothetical protein [Noviherbaspirillum galbum]|uniref:Uncharacterized protein n=1 Tax=Noviherbaspirillum galbum TaxID=2709383 RepID=A0A6B3STH1_9BURK|nr:hypothetical protein [Noviherbaspirillum galbum]NEX62645.1 hypothetical protein [Noviherbaspirillum galbum]